MQFLAGLVDVDATLRSLWASLCQLIYKLIAFLYELFINLASVKLLTNSDIKPIYQRVTMILAIIMVFYVTLEVVKYVVQPDKMTDKEKGATNVVRNMIIVVIMIAFVPTIFGWAYDLQNSLIKNQVFSKMILGRQNNDMENVGKGFSAQMFSLFYRYDDEFWESQGKSEEEVTCDGTSCAKVVQLNISTLASDGELPYIHMGLNEKEDVTISSISNAKKQEVRKITFDGLFAVVVGIFISYVLLMYCVDVGVRIAQLLFLQVVAPIPIIGYLAPKKDGMFQKWIKQCVTTYLDLFIRLAIICFVLLIVEILGDAYHSHTLVNGVGNVSGTMRTFMYIAIVMGLLLFAQKAPKMLQELFPKMGAASGNFGLKAGERVAPAAARAIGAGTGFARGLVGGAIRRHSWRVARNKANGWATGFSRLTKAGREQNRQKREQIEKNREEARMARAAQRSVARDEKQKAKFDNARDAWNDRIEKDSKVTQLKKEIKKAHEASVNASDPAAAAAAKQRAKELGAQLNARYNELKQSGDYKRWNAARKEMANSKFAQDMRQNNAAAAAAENQARNRMNQANSSRDAAQSGRDAALNRRNEVLRNRDIANGELIAAQQALTDARNSGNQADIVAAQERVRNAEANYNMAETEAREVLGGRDAAVTERNNAIVELNAAHDALEVAEASGDANAIRAAQERVRSAEANYTEADRKVNEIVQNASATVNSVAERDAAYEELERAEASGSPEAIANARRRVEAAERNYEADAVFRNRNAATRERNAAYEELERAENFGTQEEIASARRRVETAERNYETANNRIEEVDKNYQNANKRYEEANKIANDAATAYEESSKAKMGQFANNRDFFTGNAKDQYSERLQAVKNDVDRTNEQVIDDKNTHFQGFGGSAVSTVAGAFKAGATGAKAKKFEEIHKQVEQAVKNDIASVKAVQKYYDDGGTGWVDRTIQQVNKKVGTPTTYERTVLQNHALEPTIKRLEAQSALTSDVKSTADGAEDRLKDKINDLKLNAEGRTIATVDENGNKTVVQVQSGESLGAVYRRYQGMEAKAQTDAETAAKRLDEFRTSNPTISIPEGFDGPISALSVEQQQLKILQDDANKKATQASNAKYATSLVLKNAARAEFSAILSDFAENGVSDKSLAKIRSNDDYDGVAVEKVYDALKSLEVARSNPVIVADMENILRLSGKEAAFVAFMNGNITDFDTLDAIKTAAINAGNNYNRLAKADKEAKRSSETSNQTSAEKAAQDYNGGNSGK